MRCSYNQCLEQPAPESVVDDSGFISSTPGAVLAVAAVRILVALFMLRVVLVRYADLVGRCVKQHPVF
jgi:hypothetical protein